MQRYRPEVRPDVDSIAAGYPEMERDDDGDYVHIDDVKRLAAVLRQALDFAPSSEWPPMPEYTAAAREGYAILKELGQ